MTFWIYLAYPFAEELMKRCLQKVRENLKGDWMNLLSITFKFKTILLLLVGGLKLLISEKGDIALEVCKQGEIHFRVEI